MQMPAAGEYEFNPESNAVDVYVRYARRKLDRPGSPSPITTVRGSGYRFDPVTNTQPSRTDRGPPGTDAHAHCE